MKNESVFEKYAHEYDLITNAKAREKYHAKEVAALIGKCQPEHMLDAGCASGLTTYLFARAGVTAVGLDRSRLMITEAKKKYADLDLPLDFRYGQFEKLPKTMAGKFDLVVCLANSISGVTTKSGLHKSLRNFYQVLKPGGSLVLQALNYNSMKEGEIFPIRATQVKKTGYLRFARRKGKQMEITFVRLDLTAKPFGFEVFTHQFDNYSPELLTSTVRAARFGCLKRYGNLLLDKPFRKNSRDLILIGRRPD